MKSRRMAVRQLTEDLRGLQPGVWPAVWFPFGTPPDVPRVFNTSVLTVEASISAAC